MRNPTKIAVITLALLMLIPIISTAYALDTSIYEDRVNQFTGVPYGDLSQYQWLQNAGFFGSTSASGIDSQYSTHGPAPSKPSILWSMWTIGNDANRRRNGLFPDILGNEPQNRSSDIGNVTENSIPQMLAGGYIFVRSSKTSGGVTQQYVNALDPNTGALKYQIAINNTGAGNPNTIDKEGTMFRVTRTGAWDVYDTKTGAMLFTVQPAPAGTWIPELKISLQTVTGVNNSYRKIYGFNFTDILSRSGPSVRTPDNENPDWTTQINSQFSLLCGDTDNYIVFYGSSYDRRVWGVDVTNGNITFSYPSRSITRNAQYAGDGMFMLDGLQRDIVAFDSRTGEIRWEWLGGLRTYFANSGCVGDGYYYSHANDVPQSWSGCWDIKTGQLLWRLPSYISIGYMSPRYGDGKVYAQLCDGSGQGGTEIEAYQYWRDTAKLVPGTRMFACIDVVTGAIIWYSQYNYGNMGAHGPSFSSDSQIAYGNFYFNFYDVLYCISDLAGQEWPMYRGSLTQNAVTTEGGPVNLNKGPVWTFKTGAPVSATAAVVDGKVYIGSYDKNIYCLDAYTGAKIWNFTTGFFVYSSVAVVGGKVYTGADDGNIYCLNAETGAVIWTKGTGQWQGSYDYSYQATPCQAHSSPIVVGSNVYVGSVDSKLYCLDASTGNVKWSYQTNGPIMGSPMYYNGVVYIASTDILGPSRYGILYALDANSGAYIWQFNNKWGTKSNYAATPVMAENVPELGNVILVGTCGTSAYAPGQQIPGSMIVGVNVTTGAEATFADGVPMEFQYIGGTASIPGIQPPVYWDGRVYGYASQYLYCWNITGRNMNASERIIWSSFIVHNPGGVPLVTSSAAGTYVYACSDAGGIHCIDIEGNTTSKVSYSKGDFIGLSLADSSPVIWNGKMYIGHGDWNVYCFDDSPTVSTTVWANQDKGKQMFVDETVTISGGLFHEMHYTYPGLPALGYNPIDEAYYPPLKNQTVTIIINKPDGSATNITTNTDSNGLFTTMFQPNTVGNWSWAGYYAGKEFPLHTYRYSQAYTNFNEISVVSSTGGDGTVTPTATPPPTGAGIPIEYIYAAVAAIAIVIIAIAAYAFTKRGKKSTA